MTTVQQRGGNAQRGRRDYFEIGGIDDQRPPPEIDDLVGIVVFKIEAPTTHAIRITQAIERSETRGSAFLGNVLFHFSDFGGRELAVQPVKRKGGSNGRLGRPLQ